jgi:SAM-dependent methyltransferase
MSNATLRDTYDQVYRNGSAAFYTVDSWEESLLIHATLPSWRGLKVLEIGCGEGRLAALLGRRQELLTQLAAGETQVGQLRHQVAALEATAAGYAHKFGQVRQRVGRWLQAVTCCGAMYSSGPQTDIPCLWR